MPQATTFFMDDSGTKHPDHDPQPASHGRDWFALGGVLIDDEEIDGATRAVDSFRERWPQMKDAPLHSHEIRGPYKNFAWLKEENNVRGAFLEDLSRTLLSLPVIGLACVIDRPGYNARYSAQYSKEQRWSLCKTAFAIAVERATKRSILRGRKLRVYVERSSKRDEQKLKEYYDTLRSAGSWFNPGTSDRYAPTRSNEYADTLYEFRVKRKTSPMMQVADLFLWPMCIGGYDPSNRTYRELTGAGRLIDCHLSGEEVARLGIKYSCFENVAKGKQEA